MKTASSLNKEEEKAEKIDNLWLEIYTLNLYFESLKFRDTILGRCALVLSVIWIFVDVSPSIHWFEVLPAFIFVMLLYWVAQNGYLATISALFSMLLENSFNPWLKNTKNLKEEDINLIEEQRALLTNYAAECPSLRLLCFIHQNRAKKIISPAYRFYADNQEFREKLKVNCLWNFLAHFLPCEKCADKKYSVMYEIDDLVLFPKTIDKNNKPPRRNS